MEQYLALATRLLVVYLPVQLAFNVLPGVDLASSRVFSLALGAVWLLTKLKAKSCQLKAVEFPHSLLLTSYSLLLLWAAISLIGVWPFAAGLRKLAFWLSYLPLLIVALDTHRDQLSRFKLAIAVAVSGTLAALVAMVPIIMSWSAGWRMGASEAAQWWLNNVSPHFIGATVAQSVGEYPSWFAAVGFTDAFRAVGTFPDPHMLAFFLELTIPITAAVAIFNSCLAGRQVQFFRPGRTRLGRAIFKQVLWGASALLQIIVLGLTFSRGAYVGIIAAASTLALLWISWFVRQRVLARQAQSAKRKMQKNSAKLKILFGAIALGAFTLLASQPAVVGRLTDLADKSTKGRLALWQTAYETTLAHPVRGVGLGNFPYVVDPTADYRLPIYAHNLYLDISSELGLIGLALWLILIIPALRPLGLGASALATKHFISIAAAVSLIAFSVHGLFDTPLFSPQVLPLLLIVLTLAASANVKRGGSFVRKPPRPIPL